MSASLDGSAASSTRNELPAPKPEQQITLIDRTADAQQGVGRESEDGDPVPLIDRTPTEQALARKWTKQSLQQQLAQRKYAKYQDKATAADKEALLETRESTHAGKGTVQARKAKVRNLFHRSKAQYQAEKDTVIDVLYENQRGSFFFGIPLFSSKSLLNFDPNAWVNVHKKASPVDITNAQVPDPNWEWAWKSWYVDMSRDVDEEGWEYSFSFQSGFAWHGNHPWFHSFVRRRRWLRKRVRKHSTDPKGHAGKHTLEAHMMNADYFTIHPSNSRNLDSSRPPSLATSGEVPPRDDDDDDEEEQKDIRDIASLLLYLRKATIDREKLTLVRRFIRTASDELHYLDEEMPHIMALFVFQNSRQALLDMLMDQANAASTHREEHKNQDKEEGPEEKLRIDNLLHAIDAADREVKRLEYWSDIRKMAQRGHTAAAVDDSTSWPASQWQGLDNSGAAGHDVSGAKEDGMNHGELEREIEQTEEKAEEKAAQMADEQPEDDTMSSGERGDDVEDTAATGTRAGGETSDKGFFTAEEKPIKIDKGKGRAV